MMMMMMMMMLMMMMMMMMMMIMIMIWMCSWHFLTSHCSYTQSNMFSATTVRSDWSHSDLTSLSALEAKTQHIWTVLDYWNCKKVAGFASLSCLAAFQFPALTFSGEIGDNLVLLCASCVFSGADFNLHIWNLWVSEGATENEHSCKAVLHRPRITEKHNWYLNWNPWLMLTLQVLVSKSHNYSR